MFGRKMLRKLGIFREPKKNRRKGICLLFYSGIKQVYILEVPNVMWCGSIWREKKYKCTKYFIRFPFVSSHFLFTFTRNFFIHKRWISFLHISLLSAFSFRPYLCIMLYLVVVAIVVETLHLQCVDYSAPIYDRMVLNFSYFAYLWFSQIFLLSFALFPCCYCFFFVIYPWNA